MGLKASPGMSYCCMQQANDPVKIAMLLLQSSLAFLPFPTLLGHVLIVRHHFLKHVHCKGRTRSKIIYSKIKAGEHVNNGLIIN